MERSSPKGEQLNHSSREGYATVSLKTTAILCRHGYSDASYVLPACDISNSVVITSREA